MLTLDLNLSSRPFKNDTLPWVGVGLAVVALTLLTIWNVRTYRQNSNWVADLKEQYSTTRDELDQFDRRERGAQRDIEGYDLGALHVRADKANEVILWKAFSWTRLFNLLQEVLPNDVQMMSVRPIFRPQSVDRGYEAKLAGRIPVSVEGMAKSLKAFFEFERALLAHASFDQVEPEGTTRARTGALAFTLRFFYDPGVDALSDKPLPEVGGTAAVKDATGPVLSAGAAGDQAGATGAAAGQPDITQAGAVLQAPTTEAAAPGATVPATGAGEEPKRPTPPSKRRRSEPRVTADDEQGDGR